MIERHFVFLFDFIARVGETLGEIAIVGEEKHPLGLGVEPADIEETRQVRRKKIEDRIARLRIVSRGNEAARLMKHDIETALAVDEFAVDFYMVAFRGLGAEIGANSTVDHDAAGGDQLIAMPPRTESSRGEETVQAHVGTLKR